MAFEPIFTHVDPARRDLQLTTGESGVALNGPLEQRESAFAFESRKLISTEERCAIDERQLLAIVHFLKVYRHRLFGPKC